MDFLYYLFNLILQFIKIISHLTEYPLDKTYEMPL